MDLGAARERRFDADRRPPAEFGDPAPDVERTHGDKDRRYHEAVLAPGDHTTVVAPTTTGTPSPVSGPDVHVAAGSAERVRARYRTRTLALAAAGVVGIAVGVYGLAGTFGVPLA